ncbi:MAG: CotH kinase family protein [Bacteroidota bacterium]|nr:CotH kinase family protein [Bacteroidota bacterium]
MKKLIFIIFFSPFFGLSQSIYNPQDLYDMPGGLFDEDSLREIHLDFYNPNYHAYLENAWYYNPDERIPAKLTLNGIVYDSVGVRYKGNSTFCLPNDNGNRKVPYNIDINYFIEDQTLLGYKKLKLANAWMDPTFMKDIVASNIYRKYLPSGEANLIKLHVQGDYLGLYVNVESINKQFLKKHYDEKKGPLFKCDNIDRFCDTANAPSAMPPNLYYMGDDTTLYYNSYDMKSDHGWEDLVNLIKTIETDFNNIDSVLNVDRTLWAFAANQVLLNLDCYNTYYVHNYYLYQTKDGLFQMIPWDLDNSFVGAILGNFFPWSTAYEYDPYSVGEDHNNNGFLDTWEERPLVQKLLADPLYRDIYNAHLRTIINESLDTSFIRSEITHLQQLAYNAADNDQNKLFSIQDYFSNVESALWTGWWSFAGIMSTIDERKQFLLSHPEISLSGPSIYNLNISDNTVSVSVMNADFVELMVTTNEYNSKFHSFSMADDGSNGDLLANDGVFSCVFPYNGNTDVKFYIRAQNNDAISLFPERAEYEFFEYATISGLNDIVSNSKKLILITDLLGRVVKDSRNILHQPLLYIYDDGTVEKKLLFK